MIPVPNSGDGGGLDRQLAQSLRRYIERPDHGNRETLAAQLSSYMRAYLMIYLRRRRFGFDRPLAEVAADAAGLEISAFLPVGEPGHLIEGVRRFLSPSSRSAPEPPQIADTSDEALVAAAKQLLRIRSRQGGILAWKQEHPEAARILRSLKMRIKQTAGMSLRRDAGGQRIVSPRSDLHLLAMDTPTLLWHLHGVPSPYRLQAILDTLRPQLRPIGPSGGYCFLMDLVRAILLLRLEAVANETRGTGAVPIEAESMLCRDGVPFSVKLARLTDRLSLWASELLTADLEKRARRLGQRDSGAVIDSSMGPRVIAIAIDRILMPVGLGRPEWAEFPLEVLVDANLGPPPSGRASAMRVHQIEYLIRRLRHRMRARWRELL